MLHCNMPMVERYDLLGPSPERFGNPAPLGLLGLSIGCAALVPVALGVSVTPEALTSGAAHALLFGGACQLLAGLMMFGNKNGFGGTVFTCFAFLWAMNAWTLHGLAQGRVPDHAVGLSVEIVLLAIFAALTWGFGHFSKALFAFLATVDLLFVLRLARSLTGTRAVDVPIGLATALLGAIGLWLALGALLHPIVGRPIFGVGAPVFFAPKAPAFDWTLRRSLFGVLYEHWRRSGFAPLTLQELHEHLERRGVQGQVTPDLAYLAELGYVVLELGESGPQEVKSVRLHARGVDIHEQLVLHKYAAAAPAH